MAPRTEPPAPDFEALKTENEALKSKQDQLLDIVVEMQEKLETLEGGVKSVTAPVSQRQAELDAELDTLREEFKGYPNIELFERRVLVGPEAHSDIRLMDEPGVMDDPGGHNRKWHLRWFNLAKEGRAAQAEAEFYRKVEWSELRSDESLAVLERKDQYVRRGDRGMEYLYKIPLKLFVYKKKRDAARVQGLLSSESQLRDHLSGSVAGLAGRAGDNADQAGSFVHGKGFSLEITEGAKETVTL